MCKHCERIVEDVQHKETVHKFMQAAADGVNRKLREDKFPLHREVTPDDIEIELKVTAFRWNENPFAKDPRCVDLVYRGLTKAME